MKTEKTIIEKMLLHGQEIHNLLCCNNDKKTAVKAIMTMYPDISSSESAIGTNLTQFKVLYPVIQNLQNELSCIKQESLELQKDKEQLNQAVNLLANEITFLKTELENRESDSKLIACVHMNTISDFHKEIDKLVNEKAVLKKENSELKDSVNTLANENSSLKSANCLLNKEVNKLKNENEQLTINNSELIKNLNEHKQEELPMMNTQAEVKEVIGNAVLEKMLILESELNSLKTRFKALTQAEIQTIKKLSVKRFHGWNIVCDKRGFNRIFKTVNGKTVGLFIGKVFDDDKALKKIAERNLPLD
jgi:chromosome segregation ATPase